MRTEGFPFAQGVDHAEVLLIRDAVLTAYDTARTPEMSTADLRQLTQALIQAELVAESRRRAEHGVRSLTAAEEVALAKAVDNQINGVGRLQALLDVPDVEDIYIRGSCPVVLRMADKRVLLTDPIADTPEELFAQIQFLAAYHGSRERAFSTANPFLDMQLPDGSRLAAVCDNSPWPVLTIRRHAYVDVTLDDLVSMGSITPSMRRFLGACVQARLTIVVSGMPAAGKTVLLRALARELDDYVRFATLETEFELGLHTIPDRFPLLVPLECRPGSVETDAHGHPIGEITLANLLPPVLRHSVTLAIYGEVRGPEAFAFLKGRRSGAARIDVHPARQLRRRRPRPPGHHGDGGGPGDEPGVLDPPRRARRGLRGARRAARSHRHRRGRRPLLRPDRGSHHRLPDRESVHEHDLPTRRHRRRTHRGRPAGGVPASTSAEETVHENRIQSCLPARGRHLVGGSAPR